jgi:predicted aspartyl protease
MRATNPDKREEMGEVYVRVRLTNAMDAEMAERGLLESDRVRTCEVLALVDTGSTRSIISSEVVRVLGLTLRRETFGILADGSRVPAAVSSAISFELEGRETTEDAYVLGNEVLIGQTVLESTDLLVDCKDRKLIPKHAEGPLFRL